MGQYFVWLRVWNDGCYKNIIMKLQSRTFINLPGETDTRLDL